MIVKDEAHVIQEALKCVLPLISYWVICDTGSFDGTIDVVNNFFNLGDGSGSAKVPGQVKQHPWKDFGTNRSLALHEAWMLRKTHACDYIMMFDADDVIVGELTLPDVMDADAYTLQFGSQCFTYTRTSIFRCSEELQWVYKGVLHEYPSCATKEDGITTESIGGAYYVDSRRLGSRNLDKNKYLNDAHILEKAIESETDNAMRIRYTFYTAQSYYDANLHDHALSWFRKRIDDGREKGVGWQEEVFYSALRIATIMESRPEVFSEQMLVCAYMQAFQEDAERAEPLYFLSKYYRTRDRFKEGYAWGKLALGIPLPRHVKLFMLKDVYDYKVKDEVAICAYWTGRKAECKMLCEELLKRNDLTCDDRRRIKRNLEFSEAEK